MYIFFVVFQFVSCKKNIQALMIAQSLQNILCLLSYCLFFKVQKKRKILELFYVFLLSNSHLSFVLVCVYACSLCRRQEINSPPAHLQQNEREYKQGKQQVLVFIGRSQMQVQQVR